MNEKSSNQPEELHPWLAKEAEGDQELEALIRQREELYEAGAEAGGASQHGKDENMRQVETELQTKKRKKGIDPLERP